MATELRMTTRPLDRMRHRARHAVHAGGGARRGRRSAAWRAGRSTRGIHFLVPCGTTGENADAVAARDASASSRSSSTKRRGSVPVLAGAGGYDTREVMHARRRDAARRAPTGLLSVTPYYNKPTQEGPVPALPGDRRRARRCRSSSTTCRGGPAATSSSPTLVRLAAIPNIVGVKEASGNMTQMCEVCRAVPPDFIVLSGDDALTLPADGGRRARRHLGGVERDARPRWRGWSKRPSAATSPPRARSTRACCR